MAAGTAAHAGLTRLTCGVLGKLCVMSIPVCRAYDAAAVGIPARNVGGFRTPACGEVVDLVERVETAGYAVVRDTELSVSAAARLKDRAPDRCAHHLRRLGGSVAGDHA